MELNTYNGLIRSKSWIGLYWNSVYDVISNVYVRMSLAIDMSVIAREYAWVFTTLVGVAFLLTALYDVPFTSYLLEH